MQTMDNNMAYYNLLQGIIEYWQYVHELNKILVDLVEYLAINFCPSQHRLNPIAIAYVLSTNDKSKEIAIDNVTALKNKRVQKHKNNRKH